MTAIRRVEPRRRLDVAGLLLLVVGIVSGAFAYWLTTHQGVNVLILVPSVVAITLGALHLTKRELPRR